MGAWECVLNRWRLLGKMVREREKWVGCWNSLDSREVQGSAGKCVGNRDKRCRGRVRGETVEASERVRECARECERA